jgi:transposase
VDSLRESSCCPRCSTPSRAVQSYDRRKPLELPCAGKAVRLILSGKKFFCRVETCPQNVFTERLSELLEPSSRLRVRLRTVVQAIAGAFNAQGGARLGAHLGLHLSRTPVLRSLLRAPISRVGQIELGGMDDCAWKRGPRDGTVMVDLASRTIIDILPHREAKSVQSWLEGHSAIGVVSRDRGGVSADGAPWRAPFAPHVADRWHRWKNWGEAVEQFLTRTHIRLPEKPGKATEGDTEPAREPFPTSSPQKGKTPASLLRKWKLTQQIQQLQKSGMSVRHIAEERDLARGTVLKDVRHPPEMPQPKPRPLRTSLLDLSEEDL